MSAPTSDCLFHVEVLPGKGRSFVADAPIAKKTVRCCACWSNVLSSSSQNRLELHIQTLLAECPLASLALPECADRVNVCNTCLRFVGPTREQVLLAAQPPVETELWSASPLSKRVTTLCSEPLPLLADVDQDEPMVLCETCGTRFCSPACLRSDEAHGMLCGAWASASTVTDGSAPWSVFTKFALEKDETHLFAARCFAVLLHRSTVAGSDPGSGSASLLPGVFSPFTQPYVWDIESNYNEVDSSPEAIEGVRSSMRDSVATAVALFLACVTACDIAPSLVTVDTWGRMVGLLTQNAIAVKVSNPVTAYLQTVADMLPHPPAVAALQHLEPLCHCIVASGMIVDKLAEDSDDEEEDGGDATSDHSSKVSVSFMSQCFASACSLKGRKLVKTAATAVPHMSGSGLFEHFSCFNHSCVPNCVPKFFDNNRVVVFAKRDIAPGEELTISYVEEDAPLEDRTEDLASYGFVCGCERCIAERK